jgi:phospholipid/cholesterol/gamma-HCH transport system substrate-binding protein
VVTRTQHTKIIVFLLATASIVLFVLTVIGGVTLLDGKETYYVGSRESVFGLDDGAPVTMRGVSVGRVAGVRLDPKDYARVEIELELDDDVPVPRNAVAFLRLSGVTGLKTIDIDEGDLSTGVLPPGSTLPLGRSAFDELGTRALELADGAVAVMADLETLVANVSRLSETLDDDHVTAMIDRADNILRRVDAAARDLRTTLGAGRESAQEITGATRELSTLLRRATRVLRGNEGDLRAAMRSLRQASRNLQEFSRQLRAQPSRVLRSNPPRERELP